MWKQILLLFWLLLPFVMADVGESVSGFVTIRLIETQAIEMTDSILQEYILACNRFFEENMKKEVGIVNLHVRLFHSSVPNEQRRRHLRHSLRSLEADTTSTSTQILDTTLLLTGALLQSSSTSPDEWEDLLPTIVNQNSTGFIATVKASPKTNLFFEPLTRVEAYSVKQSPSSGMDDSDNERSSSSNNNHAAAVATIVSIVTMGVIGLGVVFVKIQQKRRQNRLSTFPSPKMDALAKDPSPPAPAVVISDRAKKHHAPEEEEQEEDDPAITHAVAV
jgi:hypothetical protein